MNWLRMLEPEEARKVIARLKSEVLYENYQAKSPERLRLISEYFKRVAMEEITPNYRI